MDLRPESARLSSCLSARSSSSLSYRAAMRRCLVLAIVVASVVASCASCRFSKVNPHATVGIPGRARDSAGHPFAAATVRLFREADLGQVLVGSVLAVGTLGL